MMTFQNYFAEAERRGWTLKEAAQRLLLAIVAPSANGRVLGVCRISHFIIPSPEVEKRRWRAEGRLQKIASWLCEDDEWDRHDWLEDEFMCIRLSRQQTRRSKMSAERHAALQAAAERLRFPAKPLERWEVVRQDTKPCAIPSDTWFLLEGIASDLTSHWCDDNEKPWQWKKIDWVAGVVSTFDWEWSDNPQVGHVEVEYSGLQIAPTLANELLSYSDDELRDIILAWRGTNGGIFWKNHEQDPKRGGRTQSEVRKFWRLYRNPEGKRGLAAKSIGDEATSPTK